MAANNNPNWSQDHRGQWHWTPTKDMVVEDYRVLNTRNAAGSYFSTRDANGVVRDDGRCRLIEKYGVAAL